MEAIWPALIAALPFREGAWLVWDYACGTTCYIGELAAYLTLHNTNYYLFAGHFKDCVWAIDNVAELGQAGRARLFRGKVEYLGKAACFGFARPPIWRTCAACDSWVPAPVAITRILPVSAYEGDNVKEYALCAECWDDPSRILWCRGNSPMMEECGAWLATYRDRHASKRFGRAFGRVKDIALRSGDSW